MKKFKLKLILAEAMQITDVIYNDLILLGKNFKENPIDVKITGIEDVNTYWNWYIQQLYISTEKGEMRVNVSDWIIKMPSGNYTSMGNDEFLKRYEEVTDSYEDDYSSSNIDCLKPLPRDKFYPSIVVELKNEDLTIITNPLKNQ
jgi:hypothetical protein